MRARLMKWAAPICAAVPFALGMMVAAPKQVSASNLIFTSFESCLENNDYNCVVRSGFKEFVAAPFTMGLMVAPENGRANFEIAMTAALIGEIEIAEKVFNNHTHFYNRNELGGAIIARMAFEEDADGLARFLGSISSPSVLAMSYSHSNFGRNRVPHTSKILARDAFVDALKAHIEANGIDSLLKPESFAHLDRTVQHFPMAQLPDTIFWGEHLEWAVGLIDQIEDPKMQTKVVNRIGSMAMMQLRMKDQPNWQETMQKMAAGQIARDQEMSQRKPSDALNDSDNYAMEAIGKLAFSTETNRFSTGKYARVTSIQLLHDQIFLRSSRIDPDASQALEQVYDAVSVASCRNASLLALAHAHAQRADTDRALQLIDKVLASDLAYRGDTRPECDYAGRPFALVLKSLLGDAAALAQLLAEVEAIHRDQGFSAYLKAFKVSEFSKPFEGLEHVTTHARRKAVVSALIEFQDRLYIGRPGSNASDMLIYLKSVNDPNLWMFIAREGLRVSADFSKRDAETQRIRLMELLAANEGLQDYWPDLNSTP